MKTIKFTLPDFWASALINDDASGLDDDEHDQLNEWLLNVKPGHCLSVSDEYKFTKYHDARDYVLACDCLEYIFEVSK